MDDAVRLTVLARWGATFATPKFDAGHWEPTDDASDQMPWFSPSEDVDRFIDDMYRAGWVVDFDWTSWMGTPSARAMLDDPAAVRRADIADLERLLTSVIRSERFGEGAIAEALESGLIQAIIRRAGDLMSEPIPFDRYRGGGRERLGRPGWGDGTARTGYGRAVFEQCGFTCVYCGLDMRATFENWLQLSVDHVIPAQMGRSGAYDADLVEDISNLVTCCRACNDFGNRYTVPDPRPLTDESFWDLRDRVFKTRKAAVLEKRAQQRAVFDALPTAGPDLEPPVGEPE